MLYAILFEDDPHADPSLRATHMADHLAFLAAHASEIQAAGPLLSDDQPAGGLWLVTTESPERAETLVRSDPFWPTGLRKSYRILRWHQVFAEGAPVVGTERAQKPDDSP